MTTRPVVTHGVVHKIADGLLDQRGVRVHEHTALGHREVHLDTSGAGQGSQSCHHTVDDGTAIRATAPLAASSSSGRRGRGQAPFGLATRDDSAAEFSREISLHRVFHAAGAIAFGDKVQSDGQRHSDSKRGGEEPLSQRHLAALMDARRRRRVCGSRHAYPWFSSDRFLKPNA